jgi:hypothetical protein
LKWCGRENTLEKAVQACITHDGSIHELLTKNNLEALDLMIVGVKNEYFDFADLFFWKISGIL